MRGREKNEPDPLYENEPDPLYAPQTTTVSHPRPRSRCQRAAGTWTKPRTATRAQPRGFPRSELRPFCTRRVLRRASPARQACAARSLRANSGAATAQNSALCNMAAALSWRRGTRTQWACASARQGCRARSYEARTATKPAREGQRQPARRLPRRAPRE